MAKEHKDLGREGDMGTQRPEDGGKLGGDVGKQGGDVGKQGGMPETKEWDKEKGGIGSGQEPGRTGGTPR